MTNLEELAQRLVSHAAKEANELEDDLLEAAAAIRELQAQKPIGKTACETLPGDRLVYVDLPGGFHYPENMPLYAAPVPVAEQKPVGKVVAAVDGPSDAAMIQWISNYRPAVGDLLYAAPVPVAEQKPPFGYWVYFPDEQRGEFCHALDELVDDLTNCRHEVVKLYEDAAPVPAFDVDEAMRLASLNQLDALAAYLKGQR